jgi:hypothetical protein
MREEFSKYLRNMTIRITGYDPDAIGIENTIQMLIENQNERYKYILYFFWLYSNEVRAMYEQDEYLSEVMAFSSSVLITMIENHFFRNEYIVEFVNMLEEQEGLLELARKNRVMTLDSNVYRHSLMKFIHSFIVMYRTFRGM